MAYFLTAASVAFFLLAGWALASANQIKLQSEFLVNDLHDANEQLHIELAIRGGRIADLEARIVELQKELMRAYAAKEDEPTDDSTAGLIAGLKRSLEGK
jgi:hypothetical protein